MPGRHAELGGPAGHRSPHLEVHGTVAGRAAMLGVTHWHISLSHDGGIASAVVVAEGVCRGGDA